MAWLRMTVLAVVQGITEFIPVSSSGHLVLAKHFLSFDSGDGALLEIVLHGGSLLAIMLYYRKRLAGLVTGVVRGETEARRHVFLLALGCLPAVVAYLSMGALIESLFQQPRLAAAALLVTGITVISVHRARRADAALDSRRALGVGLAQCLALVPGISRSGMTIAAARHLGMGGEAAATFSFLMLVPLLFGALVIGVWRLARGGCAGDASFGLLLLGFVVSALTSLAAIHALLVVLRRGRFWCFGIYAFFLGAVALVALHLTGS